MSYFVAVLLLASTQVDSILNRLQNTYDQINTLEAKFEQTYKSPRFGDKISTGTVLIAKPGKMRWDYDNPKGKVLVSDGKEIILYDPEDRQAMVSPAPKKGSMPLALSFLWGESKLKDEFECAVYKDEKNTLRCKPKKDIPNVLVVYFSYSDKAPYLIETTRIIDLQGGENIIRLSRLKQNVSVAPTKFAFKLPAGTHRVQMNSDK